MRLAPPIPYRTIILAGGPQPGAEELNTWPICFHCDGTGEVPNPGGLLAAVESKYGIRAGKAVAIVSHVPGGVTNPAAECVACAEWPAGCYGNTGGRMHPTQATAYRHVYAQGPGVSIQIPEQRVYRDGAGRRSTVTIEADGHYPQWTDAETLEVTIPAALATVYPCVGCGKEMEHAGHVLEGTVAP